MTVSGRRRAVHLALMIVLIAAGTEGLSYVAAEFLARKGVVYKPPPPQYEVYMRERHPILGWPSQYLYGRNYLDPSASDSIPASLRGEIPCLSAYGDSFTWGWGVDAEHAWSNLLSRRMDCPVFNFGVPGYGTDQAFLRFLYRHDDHAKIVLLCHMSENIVRNVNQFRDLLLPCDGFGLKPRFVLDGENDIRLIPLPALSEKEFLRLLENPGPYLPYEYFSPGGPTNVRVFGFPYTWLVLRSINHFHLRAVMQGEPWYADFYRSDHPSNGLEITARIIRTFQVEARKRGKVPLVVIFPSGLDFPFYRRKGVWTYAPLIERLKDDGMTPLNIGEGMSAYLGERNACELFQDCSGHYNEEGNRVVADLIHAFLKARDLIP